MGKVNTAGKPLIFDFLDISCDSEPKYFQTKKFYICKSFVALKSSNGDGTRGFTSMTNASFFQGVIWVTGYGFPPSVKIKM